jgi:O-antigen/teichoic acid export membrane protein
MVSEKKAAFKNIVRVFISNVIGLFGSILAGFLIPKIMSVTDYGYYKTFALYISYVAILHFGITDGVYMFFSGKSIDELNKQKLHSIIAFVFALEFLISALGCAVAIPLSSSKDYLLIFILVAIYNLVYHYSAILKAILEATKQFKIESAFLTIKSLINILFILLFWLLSKTTQNFQLHHYYYCALCIGLLLFLSIFYTIRLRKFVFSHGQTTSETKQDIWCYIKLGLPLLICDLTSTFINTIDRQFVSAFYPVELSKTFAVYSFAYSMLSFITTATAAVSTVLFPYMRGKNQKKLLDMYPIMLSAISAFVALAFLSYYVFEWFIPFYLPKYSESLPIFRVLLPGLILDCSVTIIMHNYYKTFNLENRFLLINLLVLALTVGTDFLMYYAVIIRLDPTNPIWFSVASIFCLIVWYIVAETVLVNKFKIKHWKNDAFAFISMSLFYLVSYCFDPKWWVGFLIYLVCISFAIFLFYRKEGKNLWMMIREKQKNKRFEALKEKQTDKNGIGQSHDTPDQGNH